MNTEIIIALISGAVTLVLGILSYLQAVRIKKLELGKKTAEADLGYLHTKLDALDILLDFEVFSEIKNTVAEIFDNTNIDRFLILIAVNGKVDFGTVSVIFEQHKYTDKAKFSVNAIAKYRELKVDPEYKIMLKSLEFNDSLYYDVLMMEKSDLKNIYMKEQVTHSYIKFIKRVKVDNENDMLVYSTAATHEADPISEQDQVYLKAMYGRIKQYIDQLT